MTDWQDKRLDRESRELDHKEREIKIERERHAHNETVRVSRREGAGEMWVAAFMLGAASATAGTFGFSWFCGLFMVASIIAVALAVARLWGLP